MSVKVGALIMSESQQAASETLTNWVQDLNSMYQVEWYNRNNVKKKACWVPVLYSDYLAGRRGFVVHIARFRCRFEGANCLMCLQELVPGSEYGVFSAKHLAQQKPGSRIDQSELNCLNQLRIVSTHGRRPSVLKVIQDQAQRFMNVNYLSNPISPIMTILDDFQTCSKCQRLVCYHRIGSPIKIGIRDENTILIPLRISLPQPSPQGEEPVEVPSYLLCRPRNRAVISVMPMKVSKSRSSNQNTDDEAQTSTQ